MATRDVNEASAVHHHSAAYMRGGAETVSAVGSCLPCSTMPRSTDHPRLPNSYAAVAWERMVLEYDGGQQAGERGEGASERGGKNFASRLLQHKLAMMVMGKRAVLFAVGH